MTSIEKKIRNNKHLFEKKFVGRVENSSILSDNIKVEFRTHWDNGWNNGKSFRPIVRTSDDTPSDGEKNSL